MGNQLSDMDQRYKILQDIVERKLSYAAHDLDHILRVTNLCILLADSKSTEEEKDADLEVLIPAALLHDIARRQEDEDSTGRTDHAVIGAEMAKGILMDLGYNPGIISRVMDCIKTHRFRSGFAPDTLEAKILFDADKLDVIGAVGIARSFMLAGEHGEKIYRDVPIDEYIKENVGSNGRIKDVSKHTANMEFELKLKRVPDRLYTEKAKEIARSRIGYMEMFFRTLKEEIDGERV